MPKYAKTSQTASSAQGTKADSALQDASQFATADQGGLATTSLQSGDLGTTTGKIPVVPVPMSSMSASVKATIDAITANNPDSAAYHPASDFATVDALALKMDEATALEMLATLQGRYDDLNQNFLLLLRFIITTFGQVPKGLESQFEKAVGV